MRSRLICGDESVLIDRGYPPTPGHPGKTVLQVVGHGEPLNRKRLLTPMFKDNQLNGGNPYCNGTSLRS